MWIYIKCLLISGLMLGGYLVVVFGKDISNVREGMAGNVCGFILFTCIVNCTECMYSRVQNKVWITIHSDVAQSFYNVSFSVLFIT